jgi:hypothetical protein
MFSFYFCLLNKTLPIVTHKPTDTPIKIPRFPPTTRLSGLPKETDGREVPEIRPLRAEDSI